MASPIDPALYPVLVTPSNTALLSFTDQFGVQHQKCRAISFVTAGDLAIKDENNATVVIPNGALVAGIMHPLSIQQILATGTAALGIVAYF